MAFFEFKNVRIAGVSAGVPKHVEKNEGGVVQSKDYDAAAFVEEYIFFGERGEFSLKNPL